MSLEQDVLQAELDRVRKAARGGDLSLDRELQARIEPLLRVAAAVHQMAEAQPSLSADRRILAALRVAANRQLEHETRTPFWRKPALALAMACAATLLLGAVSVFAAGDALPSSPLYPVRSLREQVQLFLAAGSAQRAHLHAIFARERANQLQALAKDPSRSTKDVTTLLSDIETQADEATAEAQSAPEAAAEVSQIEVDISEHLQQVEQAGELSPAESQQLSSTRESVQSAAAQANSASATQSTPNPTEAPTPSTEPTPGPTEAATPNTGPKPSPTEAATPSTDPTPSSIEAPMPAPTEIPMPAPTDAPA
jgi:hypothetical protein